MTPSSPLTAIVGACGGCGGSMVAAGIVAVAARSAATVILVDLDPGGGIHTALLGVEATRGCDDLDAVGADLEAAHIRAAAFPLPTGGALVASPSADRVDRVATLAQRLRDVADRPAMVLDMGSGPLAAARVPTGVPVVLVAARDAAGACAAAATRAALPQGTRVTLVVNEGVRRTDVPVRGLRTTLAAEAVFVLPRADREALRLAAGLDPGGQRGRLAPTLLALAGPEVGGEGRR